MHIQTETSPSSNAFDAGRKAQHRAMMQQLAQLQSKYKGVRGELLAKVAEELSHLDPAQLDAPARPPAPRPQVKSAPTPAPSPAPAAAAKAVRPTPPENMLPSCRVCGRGMKLNGAEGSLICARGHVRLLT